MHRFSLIVLSLMLVMLTGCTQMFFYPKKELVQTPADLGFKYQDVFYPSADNTQIHAWLIEPKLDSNESLAGVAYFLHGNAQNISFHIYGSLWLLNAGYRVMAIDYRGYGQSDGIADIPAVYDDIDEGFDWLLTHAVSTGQADGQKLPIVLFGQSLGASLALNWLASDEIAQSKVSHVVIDSAFSRFGTIAKEIASTHWLTWLFQYPAKWALSDENDPVDSLKKLHTPVMIVHSRDDAVVDYTHSGVLLEAGSDNVQRHSTSGPHISAFGQKQTRDAVLGWIQSHAEN